MSVTELKPQLPSLEELFTRVVATSTDRPAWLRGRAFGVTATEIAKLAKARGGAKSSTARRLIKEKLAGGDQVEDLEHVARIRFGRIREEYIAEWARRHFNAQPSNYLFRAADNERFLATPDAVGVNFDDELFIGEYKATSLDLTPDVKANKDYRATGYYDQKQWSLRVTGGRRALFVPEQHDDDWSGWPERGPATPTEPAWFWVERDEKRIAELEQLALEFLAELDAARGAVAQTVDPYLDMLAEQVVAARESESGWAAHKKEAWNKLLERVAARGGFTQEGLVRVTWSPPEDSTVHEVDHDAAVAADPALYAEFERITAAWSMHQQKFSKPKTVTKAGKLTVTPIKGEGDDA